METEEDPDDDADLGNVCCPLFAVSDDTRYVHIGFLFISLFLFFLPLYS